MAEGAHERSPIEIVEEWQRRAWEDADLDAVDELVAESIVRHGVNGSATRTRAELKQDIRQFQKGLGKPILDVRDRVAEGDTVWSRIKLRGANLQTGEPRTVDWLLIHRIADGRIAEIWSLHTSDAHWTA